MTGFPARTMVRPRSFTRLWHPGDALIMWTNGAGGVPWPVNLKLIADDNVERARMAMVPCLVRSGGQSYLVVSYGPPKTSRNTFELLLPAPEDCGGLTWLAPRSVLRTVFWSHTRLTKTRVQPPALPIPREMQAVLTAYTGVVLAECRLAASIRFVDIDTFQWWTLLPGA